MNFFLITARLNTKAMLLPVSSSIAFHILSRLARVSVGKSIKREDNAPTRNSNLILVDVNGVSQRHSRILHRPRVGITTFRMLCARSMAWGSTRYEHKKALQHVALFPQFTPHKRSTFHFTTADLLSDTTLQCLPIAVGERGRSLFLNI